MTAANVPYLNVELNVDVLSPMTNGTDVDNRD